MAIIQSASELLLNRIIECMELAREKYARAIRPVYGYIHGTAPIHIGSCILISLNNTTLIATAGHVSDYSKETKLHVAGEKGLVPLSFGFGITTNPERNRQNDLYDFSIYEISEKMKIELGDVKYISEKEMCMNLSSDRGYVRMAMGFPTSKNKKGIDAPKKSIAGTLWSYISFSLQDSEVAKQLNINDDDHAFLDFNDKRSYNRDATTTHALSPTGASGGALLDLGNLSDLKKLADPATSEARLAGMLIEYRSRDKMIVATRINNIIEGYQLAKQRAVSAIENLLPAH